MIKEEYFAISVIVPILAIVTLLLGIFIGVLIGK